MIPRYSLPEMAALWSPEKKFQKWLEVELAICDAWAAQGVAPADAVARIRQEARFSVDRIDALEAEMHHDVVAFLGSVQENLDPDDARWLHFGVTSSDVVDTALSLLLVAASRRLRADLDRLVALTAARAREHAQTLMAGRTHGVHAEPITLGLKILLWHEELKRQLVRLQQATESIRVGKISGAVGTHATIPPAVQEHVCRVLGLEPAAVSSQVLQRDRHAHFATTLALIAGTVEKVAVECRHLQRTEVLEAQEPFREGQMGSSSMPHKRNPVGFEQLCGLARVVRANAVAALEDMPLWHERDISHSSAERVILPDACMLLDYMLVRLERLLRDLVVFPERMRRNLGATGGLLYSQRILLALIDRGMPRPEAYDLVQQAARRVWDGGGTLGERLREDPRFSIPPQEVAELMDPTWYLRHLPAIFARAGVPLDAEGDPGD